MPMSMPTIFPSHSANNASTDSAPLSSSFSFTATHLYNSLSHSLQTARNAFCEQTKLCPVQHSFRRPSDAFCEDSCPPPGSPRLHEPPGNYRAWYLLKLGEDQQ
mmetsp:Transcript_32471/g.79743  ORF Transcript_32471/g.79743 Transcript_32471/m.79743 type:complete len:104 (-) Transcript_32471:605-916(-)